MTIAATCSVLLALAAPPEVHRSSRFLMGAEVEISVWHHDAKAARRAIERALDEVERLQDVLSEWRPESEISQVNRQAALGPVVVGPDTWAVLSRGLEVSALSGGAFDMTWAALRGLWDFKAEVPKLPDAARLKGAVAHIGWRKVSLDAGARSVRFTEPGVSLGLGGIAQGYGADRAAAVLEAAGIRDAVIDVSGDVLVRGTRGGAPWRIGVQHPRAPRGTLLAVVAASDVAVVTSGDYERFFLLDGRRYHHVIDPRTGMPSHGAMSVTVLAPRAIDADALTKVVMVLGPARGLAVLETLPGVHAFAVASDGSLHFTKGARARFELKLDRVDPRPSN